MQYFGFALTPLLGAILAAVGNKNKFIIPLIRLSINEYSLPALFMGFLAVGNCLLLHHDFQDREKREPSVEFKNISTASTGIEIASAAATSVVDVVPSAAPSEIDNVSQVEPSLTHLMSYIFNVNDTKMVVIASCFMNMAMKGTVGVFETLGSEFVTKTFYWDSLDTGYTFATFGFMGVLSLLSFPILQKFRISDLDIMTAGAVLMTMSCFLLCAEGIK